MKKLIEGNTYTLKFDNGKTEEATFVTFCENRRLPYIFINNAGTIETDESCIVEE